MRRHRRAHPTPHRWTIMLAGVAAETTLLASSKEAAQPKGDLPHAGIRGASPHLASADADGDLVDDDPLCCDLTSDWWM